MATLALCIPAFNAENYLPRLLGSAARQRIPFDEIWVYNDCSQDDTAVVAAGFGANVVNGDINRGCSYGKNQLARMTRCDWIHFHDADDDLTPDFTERVHDWIGTCSKEYQVLLLNFNYIDFKTGTLLGTAGHNAEEMHSDALRYAITHKIVNFGVYERSAFLNAGGFDLDENVLYNEDNAFHQRLAKNGLQFDYLPEVTCVNYRYSASMSVSNELKCARANFHVLEKTVKTHGEVYPAELSMQLWNCATLLGSAQDWAYVQRALSLIRRLNDPALPGGNRLFRLTAAVSPFFAIWFREKMIRLFKSHLRRHD